MSKYRVFSGPYFPVFGLNIGKYGPEENPCLNTFHAVIMNETLKILLLLLLLLSLLLLLLLSLLLFLLLSSSLLLLLLLLLY